MVVLRIILGVLLIMCSFSILSIPALNGIVICWMASIAMLVAGIVAIVNFIENKNAEHVAKKNGQPYLKTGIGSLVFGIVAIILSILARRSEVFVQLITILFGLWITLDGIGLFITGLGFKKIAQPGWLAMMILGVLVVILGIACVVNSFTSLVAMGTMFGVSMMFAGISLMFGEQG